MKRAWSSLALVTLIACNGKVLSSSSAPEEPEGSPNGRSRAATSAPASEAIACPGAPPECVYMCNTDAPRFRDSICVDEKWQCPDDWIESRICYESDPCPFWMPITCCENGVEVPHECTPGGAPVCPKGSEQLSTCAIDAGAAASDATAD